MAPYQWFTWSSKLNRELHGSEMTDRYEKFVRWYLRFNGYFCVENFILHKPIGRSILQGGEFDVLAVRFPHSHEDKFAGVPIQNDAELQLVRDRRLPASIRGEAIDFVVAEVKSGSPDLNGVWMEPDTDGEKTARIEYLLSWMGPIADRDILQKTSSELRHRLWSVSGVHAFRVITFCFREQLGTIKDERVLPITFEDIAEWIVTARTPCWRERGLGARSAHQQWDEMIQRIWKCGDPRIEMDKMARVAGIMTILASRE
jgi:hypothetical protein